MPIRYDQDRLWYKDAVIYEIHVRSFYDSNGDGIGDFRGLTQKLSFLHDLGVTAVWLLPFYPSPLKDDGYDIADYCRVHPSYGTLEDFQEFLHTAHHFGIRVITELVLNHTSDQHPWFQKARRAKPGSRWRDFYVWSDTSEKYQEARIIFQDFETSNWSWDPVARAYYWHRFYSHQPDLNYDNPKVHRMMLKVIDFWMDMGVDGVRLDAVPYLYEREGTNCENLPETYDYLKKLRAHMDDRHPGRMLLAEANQWPEDAVSYFGTGDACNMAFHFPLMPRMFMAVQMEDSFPITNILEQTPKIPEECQWAVFLRNHDELTLEMVTDEERDYMYRVYARDAGARINLGIRRRLAPLMGNDRRKIELMNVLLFSLPGTPIIYYGDEIGMGDNFYLGDRNGVRTPMQWSPDRNAGFSPANPQSIYLPVIIDPEYHYETVNVENQLRNPSSFLWWMRNLIDLRKRYPAFSRGVVEFLSLDNPKVLGFIRRHEEQVILVMMNLSRFSQSVEINSPRFAGYVPEDLFSRQRFPPVKDSPYVIILGPHDYHLLLLHSEKVRSSTALGGELPSRRVKGKWQKVMDRSPKEWLERAVLPPYLLKCRWFGGKGLTIKEVRIASSFSLPAGDTTLLVCLMEVLYNERVSENYLLPLQFIRAAEADELQKSSPEALIAKLEPDEGEGYIYDGLYDVRFRETLFSLLTQRQKLSVDGGEIWGMPGRMLRRLLGNRVSVPGSQIGKVEQSNTTIFYDTSFFCKLYRRIEEGVNPEAEMGRYLTERVKFANTPPFAASIEFRRQGEKGITMAILQGYVANQSDGWVHATGEITQYLDRVLARGKELEKAPRISLFGADSDDEIPPRLQEIVGGFYPEMAALLGKRTGELHLALASRTDDAAFAPELNSLLYQRSVYQSMHSQVKRNISLLRKNIKKLPQEMRIDADAVLSLEEEILQRFSRFMDKKHISMQIRIHGDYHLGQVLFTGNDFMIIDFEGEPSRSMSERRIKKSPVRDVAGMIHSFQYAAYAVLYQRNYVREEQIDLVTPWVEAWQQYASRIYLEAYLQTMGTSALIPQEADDFRIMLNSFLLDKMIYVLGYEMNNRPGWVTMPLKQIRGMIEEWQ